MVRKALRKTVRRLGYDLLPTHLRNDIERDVEFMELYRRCKPYSMTSVERMYALCTAVRYVAAHGIGGAIVECGVWRGGSSMLSALTLSAAGDGTRPLYLFDTFSGMPEPGERDVNWKGVNARSVWSRRRRGDGSDWAYATVDEVRANMASTGYDAGRLHFVEGRVEDTIPGHAPDTIAVLRLDTDWYASTRHELEHLYPRLAEGGVLIVDDYGHWSGARQATDEYFAGDPTAPFLERIDYTGRLAIKRSPGGGVSP
jgi:O-methyltransferase